MPAFKLTERARTFLQSRGDASGIDSPVVLLQYNLGDLDPNGETVRALRRGSTLEEIKHRQRDEIAGTAQEPKRLLPAFFPRAELPSDDLFTVEGVEFCMPAALVAYLSRFSLDLDDSQALCFIDERGERHEY
jgi:hypothetical protein